MSASETKPTVEDLAASIELQARLKASSCRKESEQLTREVARLHAALRGVGEGPVRKAILDLAEATSCEARKHKVWSDVYAVIAAELLEASANVLDGQREEEA